MSTTTPGIPVAAAPGSDPLRIAASLRRSYLDTDVLPARLRHLLVDALTSATLLAVPVLLTVLATVAGLSPGGATPLLACLLACSAVLIAHHVVWPLLDGGRTAGMRACGVRVVTLEGEAPGAAALTLRWLLLPLDLLGPGLLLVTTRRDRRRIGDLVAGTMVVREPHVIDLGTARR